MKLPAFSTIQWVLTVVVVGVLAFSVWNFWDDLWGAMPWSRKSQLIEAKNELDISKADATLDEAQQGEKDAIYGRDIEYYIRQPIIIRQTEAAAAQAESASDDRAASNAFIAGVCAHKVAANQPGCTTQDDTSGG